MTTAPFMSSEVEALWTGTPLNSANGYAGGAWYTAVPEPTSGLLMLLGMAGLALKRKRA